MTRRASPRPHDRDGYNKKYSVNKYDVKLINSNSRFGLFCSTSLNSIIEYTSPHTQQTVSDQERYLSHLRVQFSMWGLGAIRDGAAGLVKQGAGAVKQGVEAGAKLLENLDEVLYRNDVY